MFTRDVRRRSAHASPTTLVAALALGASVAACSAADRPTAPAPRATELRGMAFLVDVDVDAGTARVTRPAAARLAADGPSFSLVGGDAVDLVASNLRRSAAGAGRSLVRFDVAIASTLAAMDLVTPTWPAPPSTQGVILVPVGVYRGGERLVRAVPSADWDGDGTPGSGAPHNFFNDFACGPAVDSDCQRWEAFAQPLLAGATSETHTVGFEIPSAVPQFQAWLVVAADLRQSRFGTLAGAVTSPEIGSVAGATITALGRAATTGVGGSYAVQRVPAGQVTAASSGLPNGCADPGPGSTTVPVGGVGTLDFVVHCFGTLRGTVSSGAGGLPGVAVSVGSATTVTDSKGGYAFTLPPGSYLPVLGAGLPATCRVQAASFTQVSLGATAVADFAASCTGGIRAILEDAEGTASEYHGVTAAAGGATAPFQWDSYTRVTTADLAGLPSGRATLGALGLHASCRSLAPMPVLVPAGGSVDAHLIVDCDAEFTLWFFSRDYSSQHVPGVSFTIAHPRTGFVTAGSSTGQYNNYSSHGTRQPTGSFVVSVDAMPPGCIAPPPTTVVAIPGFTNNGQTIVIPVTCNVGYIAGTVDMNLSGAYVPYVAGVTVTASGTGGRFSTTTDGAGHYALDDLPVGSYTLSFDAHRAGCANPSSVAVVLSRNQHDRFDAGVICP